MSSVQISKESTHRQTTTQTHPENQGVQETVQRLWTGLMQISALTFGTLLSSQESDAHRSLASQPGSRGNLRYSTGPDPPSQDPIFLTLRPRPADRPESGDTFRLH